MLPESIHVIRMLSPHFAVQLAGHAFPTSSACWKTRHTRTARSPSVRSYGVHVQIRIGTKQHVVTFAWVRIQSRMRVSFLAKIGLGNPVNDDTGSMVSRGDGSFCCGPDATAGTCDCSNNLGTINLGSGEPVAVIDGSNGGYSTTGLPYTASADFPSSSTSAMSSSTSATSGSTLTTAVSSFGPSSTTSSAALPLNSGTSVRPQSSSAAASSAEISVIDTDWFKGVIAVVAVLCIALIGLIVWCCWLGPLGRRRRERRQNDSASQKEPKPVSVNPEYQADPHPLHQEPAIVPNPYAQSSTTINNSRQYVGRDPVGQSFDRGNANQYQPAMTDGLSDIDDDDGSEAGPSYLANQSYIDGAYDSTPQATAFTMSQEPLRMASRRKPVGSSKFARSPAPFSPTDVGNPYAEPSPFARPSSGQPYTRYGDRPHQRPPSYRTMASPSSAPSLRRGASDAMDHAYERRSRTPGPSGTIREE